MEHSNGIISDLSSTPNKLDNAEINSDVKKCSITENCKNNGSVNDCISSEVSQEVANAQNIYSDKLPAEHANCLSENNCDISSSDISTMHLENDSRETVNKLIEMVEKLDNTESIINSPLANHSSNSVESDNMIDHFEKSNVDNKIISLATNVKNEDAIDINSNGNMSEDLDDDIILISPTDSKEKEDSSEEIEIIEEITKTQFGKTKTTFLNSQEKLISSHCNTQEHQYNELPNVENKLLENMEPLNMSINSEPLNMSLSNNENSGNCLKNLLQGKACDVLSTTVPCLKEGENDSLSQSSNEVEKIESVIKLTKEETGFPDFFEGFVSMYKYEPVIGNFTLKGNEALVDCPSLVTPFLVKKDQLTPSQPKSLLDNQTFFNTAAGNFLLTIGFSRVREWYHRDMAKIKSHRIKNSGKTDALIQELKGHQTNYLQAKKANEQFVSSFKTCSICNFSTESSIVLEGHMLVPHITPKREYQCNYCSYLHRDPQSILGHMKLSHNKTGHIEVISSGYECPCCIFETNSRVKLNTHLNRCMKYFNHSKNQAPMRDFEFPCLTPKPITVSIVKSYEKSVSGTVTPKGRPPKPIEQIQDYSQPHSYSYNNQLSKYRNISPKIAFSDAMRDQMYQNVNSHNSGMSTLQHNSSNYLNNMNSVLSNIPQSQFPFLPQKNKAIKTFHSGTPMNNSSLVCGPQELNKISSPFSPEMLPRLQGPFQSPPQKEKLPSNVSAPSQNLVVCEICDGYIKDLEQLRMHMQLIHKIKIHPKMLSSRPPLNCQKCFWRFFTDHGLERHLLGSHGLVTSNMQELAEKNKDTGCCNICGKVYASKLVAHMNQVHNIVLKPANLSYKCTVCSATFGLYRLFENHVYLVHAGGTKRSSSENSPIPRKTVKLNGPSF